MTFYSFLLAAHNQLRWLVLVTAVLMLIILFRGWNGQIPWRPHDDRLNKVFVGLFDLEVFVGAVLYYTSKITHAAFQDFGQLMSVKLTRFFGLEHPLAMIVALVLVHAGSVMGRRAEGAARYRRMAIMYTLALGIVSASIPWWRPLLRF